MSTTPTERASAFEKRKLLVCASADLTDRQHRIIPVLFKHEPQSAIVLRHGGQVYAYLNQCVHMVRRLDCIHDAVFDAEHEHLRCSMHGIVYDPVTGESLSVLCAGERLEALRSMEVDGQIYLVDKRVTGLT
ncbi:Rieske (2Fe-2S) protein [Thiocapsa rosea]|uniref:Nitrite reductase/ring-hydroxylating ferredoxin subunit n=1 Tax=Thiocapsa rosea TaxID=69360 RepID=A0A495VAS5_9GAMM|nr:Rieske 2Fe-2S domain-containing protein [Thiocapsa rosea]RKT46496.1 nitrite reductase/ring-hydroxylating ferredoxin subunit [Thiocapsa rosea]